MKTPTGFPPQATSPFLWCPPPLLPHWCLEAIIFLHIPKGTMKSSTGAQMKTLQRSPSTCQVYKLPHRSDSHTVVGGRGGRGVLRRAPLHHYVFCSLVCRSPDGNREWPVIPAIRNNRKIRGASARRSRGRRRYSFPFRALSVSPVLCVLRRRGSEPRRLLQTERLRTGRGRRVRRSPAPRRGPAVPEGGVRPLHLGGRRLGGGEYRVLAPGPAAPHG